MVADGAGGHARGDVASRMIAESLAEVSASPSAGALAADVQRRLAATHAALRDPSLNGGAADIMASTVVVLVACAGTYACLWAGDSRLYLLRDGQFTQISKDHSLVQELVDSGAIRREDAERHPHANVITRALGSEEATLRLDRVGGIYQAGDRFLLCSDGLCKTLDDAEMARHMREGDGESLAARLVAAALERRARDNVTAVTVEILADD